MTRTGPLTDTTSPVACPAIVTVPSSTTTSPAVWPAGTTAPPVITTWSVAADAVPAASKSAVSADSNAAIAARTAWGVDIWTLLRPRVQSSVASDPARRKAHVAARTLDAGGDRGVACQAASRSWFQAMATARACPCVRLLPSGAPRFLLGVAEHVALIHAVRKPDVSGIPDVEPLAGDPVRIVIACA